MPAAFAYDLRERAVAEGISRRHVARQFKGGISTVIRWMGLAGGDRQLPATPSSSDHKSKAVGIHKDCLLDLVKAETDLTLTEIHARLHSTHRLTKDFSCLWHFFTRDDITFEKTLHAVEHDHEDVKAAREVWR